MFPYNVPYTLKSALCPEKGAIWDAASAVSYK